MNQKLYMYITKLRIYMSQYIKIILNKHLNGKTDL